jgi:putative FmdB family regulatory protein
MQTPETTMTYDYLCTSCGHAWEAEQRISEPALKQCPSCKQDTAKRQVSGGAGFILKGGGWYSDLYSSSKPADKPSEAAEPKQGEAKSAGGDAGKSSPKKEAGTAGDSGSGSGGKDGGGGSGGSGGSGGKPTKTEAA